MSNDEIDLIYNTSKSVLELNISEHLRQPDFDWDEDEKYEDDQSKSSDEDED